MIATISHKNSVFEVDLTKPLDISIPLTAGKTNVNAWYAEPIRIEPVRVGNFIGDVKAGGSVNFRNIFFNPHGNGTHTENVGHITPEHISINQTLKQFFFIARVVSISPEILGNGDRMITAEQISVFELDKTGTGISSLFPDALIIRTLPNSTSKKTFQYSGTNPAFLEAEAAVIIRNSGIDHLLLDLPSVDREHDGGRLAAHKAFWEYPANTQIHRTITEMVYVPNEIDDGLYLLNLQIANFENDASPSKPILYKIMALR